MNMIKSFDTYIAENYFDKMKAISCTGVISKVRTNELDKKNNIRVSSFIITQDNGSLMPAVAWQRDHMPNLTTLKDGDTVKIVGRIKADMYSNSAGDPVEYKEILVDRLELA